MRFMVTLIRDETDAEAPEEMKERGARMMEFMGELQESGALKDSGGRLKPSDTARTLRYGKDGKQVVTDGPFAESKEQVAGYMVLECADLDEAFGWAERLPIGRGSIEVRPIDDSPPRADG
jgi:hypothetical protein